MALGATPGRLLLRTVMQAVQLIAIGLVVGGLLSLAAVRGLARVSFVGPELDVVSVVLAATLLVATGLAAVLPAALQAARTDPLTALRAE